MKKFLFLGALLLSTPQLFANPTVGIIASLKSSTQEKISKAVKTNAATQKWIQQTNHPQSQFYYWIERKDSESYHTTLDMIRRRDGQDLTPQDENTILALIKDFSADAVYLNQAAKAFTRQNGNPGKAYRGNGYELRLFVHYTDGSSGQFNAKNIDSILQSQKDISYANLVLKIGTHGQLRDDWKEIRNDHLCQGQAAYVDYESDALKHDLETHITIARLVKCTKKQHSIIQGKLKRNNGKNLFSTAFDKNKRYEMQMLVDAFKLTNSKVRWADLKNISYDRLQITELDKQGNINIIEELLL